MQVLKIGLDWKREGEETTDLLTHALHYIPVKKMLHKQFTDLLYRRVILGTYMRRGGSFESAKLTG